MKFGGTSVGSVESILRVKRIVEAQQEPVIVVVSALGGITDKLIQTSRMAAAGDAAYENEFREIVSRHVEMVKRVFAEFDAQMTVQRQVGELLNELKDIFQGIYLIKDLSQKTSDTIVSYGERLSSSIAAQLTGAQWFDSRQFIKTEKKYSKHVLDTDLTNQLVRETFRDLPRLSLVPGFIATDKTTGEVTNLGRGGSDYTAAIIAAALDADSLEIWTDVDGFMTADPRVISTAYTINELSYVEATELCNFGAKVVYPPTIYPVCHKNIPILIKNTFNPEGGGTIIKQEVSDPRSKAIKGISSINDTSLITVQGLGMVGVIGVNYRIFKALAKNGISVFLVSQASSENSTSIGVRNADADLACEVLTTEFAKEIEMGEISPILAEKNLATVAIVGENMKHTPGIAGKLFGTLGRNGINVIACAQGASETNISFVVDSKSLRKSLNVIHDSFFLSEYQVLNLFICGIGTVGGSLIEQIHSQRQKLMQENGPEGAAQQYGGPARRHHRHEHLQLRLRGLHGQCRCGRHLQGIALAQCLRGGRQQDCRLVGLRQLPRIEADSPSAWREVPLRDQRGGRSAHHQHHQRPHPQRRQDLEDRSRVERHVELYLQQAQCRRSFQQGHPHGAD